MKKQILLIILILLIIFMIYAIYNLELVRYCKLWNNSDLETLEAKFLAKESTNKQRIVVTLSTIPDRIEFLGPTIASILDQTMKVDEIAINIPYQSRKGLPYNIPTWLSNLKSVKIHRIVKDIGPATKILPTLRREKHDTLIITKDDDVIYNSNTIEKLVQNYHKYKGQAAITNFGIVLQNNGDLPKASSRVGGFFSHSTEVDLLQGFSGFLVTPRMFPKEVFDLDKGPKEAISVDDIWLSGWLRYNGVKIMTAGKTFKQLSLVNMGKMRQTTALGKGENKEFVRDQIVIQWFIKEKNVSPIVNSL